MGGAGTWRARGRDLLLQRPSAQARRDGHECGGQPRLRRKWQHDRPAAADGVAYLQGWDTENRLVSVSNLATGQGATYVYDGDGRLVKGVVNGVTTYYAGEWYEQQGAAWTAYYSAGGERLAVRKVGYGSGNGLYWLLRDQLGSTSLTVDGAGAKVAELRYKAYGETRYSTAPHRRAGGTRGRGRRRAWGCTRWGRGGMTRRWHGGSRRTRWYRSRGSRRCSTDTLMSWGNPLALCIDQVTSPFLHFQSLRYHNCSWTRSITHMLSLCGPTRYVGIPVLCAGLRESQGDAPEALTLTLDWYFERGEAPRTFGTESEITQHLITDVGVQEARSAFKEGGGKDMVGIGHDAHEYKFDTEFFGEARKAILDDDWSGSFLGGYHVEFKNLDGYEGSGNLVEVTVINDTGWASGTHVPFTSYTLRDNEARSYPGPGGTLWQYYVWTEVIHVD